MDPKGPPPSYDEAANTSTSSTQPTTSSSHLTIPQSRNGITPERRRSMEDETRPLPPNWVRQYDSQSHHHFYVDTTQTPPRSIWHHPYDDMDYLSTLPPSERHRVQEMQRVPTHHDIMAESSDDDSSHGGDWHARYPELPPREAGEAKGVHKLGRRMKDKLTGSTHAEREEKRRLREEEERRAYMQHQHIRQMMQKAAETGEPQLLGKDEHGVDVYIEPPPRDPYGGGGYGGGYGYDPYGGRGYGGGYGNARFVRPPGPYGRPYYGGYGGGMGLPLMGMGMGLGGGMMLGSMI